MCSHHVYDTSKVPSVTDSHTISQPHPFLYHKQIYAGYFICLCFCVPLTCNPRWPTYSPFISSPTPGVLSISWPSWSSSCSVGFTPIFMLGSFPFWQFPCPVPFSFPLIAGSGCAYSCCETSWCDVHSQTSHLISRQWDKSQHSYRQKVTIKLTVNVLEKL